ncbi:MAG: YkgJ family cysteine cluster protein [Flavobacteriales bacterium]|nr:YkgJ family cysteine cluster protein [Flavobacteriales bacterium]
MEDRYREYLHQASSNRKENKKLLQRWGKNPPNNLDQQFHVQHDKAFEEIECLQCANCCKTTSPIFRNVDIDRISHHLGIKPSAFTEKYLHVDGDGDWVLNSAPCAFLGSDNYCSIYEDRPKACREYPHTDRKNMYQIMDLTYRNSLICPAVARVVEKMKALV